MTNEEIWCAQQRGQFNEKLRTSSAIKYGEIKDTGLTEDAISNLKNRKATGTDNLN